LLVMILLKFRVQMKNQGEVQSIKKTAWL